MKEIDLEHCFNNQVRCPQRSVHSRLPNCGLWTECRGLKAADYKERDF